MSSARNRLFGLVMFWTIATTVFAWLPLVRIIGRPEGYQWGLLGLRGSGTEGPFWVFIPLTAYAVTLLFTAFRGPRAVFYPLLLLCVGLVFFRAGTNYNWVTAVAIVLTVSHWILLAVSFKPRPDLEAGAVRISRP